MMTNWSKINNARGDTPSGQPAKPVIGVIGVGVLGGVVRTYFEDNGHEVLVYDKFQDLGTLDAVNNADVVFVCVPTPYLEDRGFDVSAVEEVVGGLKAGCTLVIRSTVPPGTTESLQRRYPRHNIFFNPEFLREKTAMEDFLRPDRQIMGCCGDKQAEAAHLLTLLPAAPYVRVMSATSAELIKMATNAFLSLKVIFGNQVFDVADALGIDYDEVKASIAADPRIGGSHLDVFDGGYRGYGGKCLPKDTAGLIDFADQLGAPMELLRTVQSLNEQLVRTPSPQRRAA